MQMRCQRHTVAATSGPPTAKHAERAAAAAAAKSWSPDAKASAAMRRQGSTQQLRLWGRTLPAESAVMILRACTQGGRREK